MSLRRLLGLSAAISGRLSRSLSTSMGAYSRPPWILFDQVTLTTRSAALGASVRIVEPPRFSALTVPALLVDAGAGPDPDSDVTQLLIGRVCSTSADGLLFLIVYDLHATAPILAKQGANHVRQLTGLDPGHTPDITRFLCNPLTGQLTRLPAIGAGQEKFGCGPHMGVLTQAGRAHGDPGRLAVAELQGNMMLLFLSDTAEWEVAVTAPWQLPLARRFYSETGRTDQEAFAFGGRLWWADLSWGVISADPFSDRPEPHFVELPRGSVVPARPERAAGWLDLEGMKAVSRAALGRYRRMGVSEGRVRYAEVWEREPFVLSSFALDDEGGGWTLEHRMALSRLWAGGDYPWLPLPEKTTPQIGALDPLNGNVIYLTVGMHIIGVDMSKEEVIGSSLHNGSTFCVSCVLPPSLESTRIYAAGNRFNCY
ncbi:hypothetical protein VPH35_109544 [Triticum aestivum]|uniref:DUF1618 domain-containing protein n=1 Tax=Triticum turgidum subsp. durum TaxID=4567 RepID=A0A9R0YG23_TRITD|nr:unnamed protein product [Triticum turgidum subsp. durum]